ncbi:hypothetical protein THAOC_21862 [Thalassiosira oceanica]|uniref:Uncharacterized protein n=1 Tax=Thalassiosira oceanica TaxID=159749 RepID=K0S001_THAOC|nr:hypothetical protein THAOC_21862 [Thalassiosira oceanica]|eukprot:EJK58044.1 hypothetical protein THAOC_21862 [Thalassiosira oceanica]
MTYPEEHTASLIADLKAKHKAMQNTRTPPAKTRANDHVMATDTRANDRADTMTDMDANTSNAILPDSPVPLQVNRDDSSHDDDSIAAKIAKLRESIATLDKDLDNRISTLERTWAREDMDLDERLEKTGATRLNKLEQHWAKLAQRIATLKSKIMHVNLKTDALDQTVVRDVEEPVEDVPAEEDALDQTMVRDVEDHGEEAMAEEVALDQMTKVRCVDEPEEVTDEEAPAAAVILAPVGAQVEARDDRDSGEDGQPMTTDRYTSDDTDSEDGTVPMIVTPPKLPPAPDPIPSSAFKIAVNTVSGPKSGQDHKPELTFTSPPTTAPAQPSDNYDREWLQTSPPPDPYAPKPSKPRSTPTNASDQPSANYDKEWLQTSPPPDPSVPTPKRDSRNRQSTGYQTKPRRTHPCPSLRLPPGSQRPRWPSLQRVYGL